MKELWAAVIAPDQVLPTPLLLPLLGHPLDPMMSTLVTPTTINKTGQGRGSRVEFWGMQAPGKHIPLGFWRECG
jgi:hypothetical protein